LEGDCFYFFADFIMIPALNVVEVFTLESNLFRICAVTTSRVSCRQLAPPPIAPLVSFPLAVLPYLPTTETVVQVSQNRSATAMSNPSFSLFADGMSFHMHARHEAK